MATIYAPSQYQFRDTREWEQEMALWLAENEPFWRLKRYNYDRSAWEFIGFDTEAECVAAYREAIREQMRREDTRSPFYEYYSPDRGARTRYAAPGTAIPTLPAYRPVDKLDGGSRADYRLAGFKRY